MMRSGRDGEAERRSIDVLAASRGDDVETPADEQTGGGLPDGLLVVDDDDGPAREHADSALGRRLDADRRILGERQRDFETGAPSGLGAQLELAVEQFGEA